MVNRMKKVDRTSIPLSLKQNGASWTQALVNEVKIKGVYKDVDDSFKTKYKQQDVQRALEAMYYEKCCYCEQIIGAESYEHIEHLRPKSNLAFHHLAFEWNNLHWSCPKCNMAKKAQWDWNNPILDPTVDDPRQHLTLNLITGELVSKTLRGQTTIDHTQLNREKLKKARKRTLEKLRKLELCVKQTPSKIDDFYLVSLLLDYTENEEEFSSLVQHYVEKICKTL